MRSLLMILVVSWMGINCCLAQQTYYDVTAGYGYGVRFWQADGFKIHMGNSSEYHFGPVTDYSIKTNMDMTTGRGWTWGTSGATPVASINNLGHMQIAGNFKSYNLGIGSTNYDYAGPSQYGAIEFPRGEITFSNTNSQNQLYLMGNAYMGADGSFHYRNTSVVSGVGFDNGGTFFLSAPSGTQGSAVPLTTNLFLKNDGNVGIGTSTPSAKLHLNAPDPSLRLGSSTAAEGFNGEIGSIVFARHLDLNISSKIYSSAQWAVDQYSGGDLRFATTPPNTYGAGSLPLTDRMVINSIGNIGIGTATPFTKLAMGAVVGLVSTSGIGLGTDNNSIEFLNSSSGSGYGAKLYGTDQGTGLTDFRIAVRGSSTSWYDAFYVRAADNGAGGGNLGYVGIGTNHPTQRLTVNGTVYSTEVKVDASVPPDYVFEKGYALPSLDAVKSYIDRNKHLPEVPSAAEMEKNGVQLGEMNMLLLKKVEEMTLYMLGQQKQIDEQNQEIKALKSEIDLMKTKIEKQ